MVGDASLQNLKVLFHAKQFSRDRQAMLFEKIETDAQVISFVAQINQCTRRRLEFLSHETRPPQKSDELLHRGE